jgi:hypothetical protein
MTRQGGIMTVLLYLGAYALISLLIATVAFGIDPSVQTFAFYLLGWPLLVAVLGFLLMWSFVTTRGSRKI